MRVYVVRKIKTDEVRNRTIHYEPQIKRYGITNFFKMCRPWRIFSHQTLFPNQKSYPFIIGKQRQIDGVDLGMYRRRLTIFSRTEVLENQGGDFYGRFFTADPYITLKLKGLRCASPNLIFLSRGGIIAVDGSHTDLWGNLYDGVFSEYY